MAVIRNDDYDTARRMALTAAEGIKLLEITWNTDRAEKLIPRLQQELPDCYIGTGTILDRSMAQRAIACGSSFIFTPHTDPQLIELANQAQVPIVPGATTPTEILQAYQAGAEVVKVFPIKLLGGVDYLKCLTPVMPHIPLLPTGGVTIADACQYLAAGAIAVGIASDLFSGGNEAIWRAKIRELNDRLQPYIQQNG
jgi:2-dehydro-3-deoxyphosphogluconate aldolase/(4S)-4-hydroxy-2-oxoglutarate aldolase